jgi:hypothetical protein
MTHEILIAESRKELEWLDLKDQYPKMLFDYAIQSYPVCLYLLKQLAEMNWAYANLYLHQILQKLIELQIVNSKSQQPQIVIFCKNNIIHTKLSTIECMLSLERILYNSSYSYGQYASIDVSKIKEQSFLNRFLKQKEEVFIQQKIAFPRFPKKIAIGDNVENKMDHFAEEFVSQIGYYLHVKSKTCDFAMANLFASGNAKATNKNASNIPVGLSGKTNQSFTEIRLGHNSKFSFHRTLRVPETGQKHQLPADFGTLPIHRIEDYADKVPAHWLEDGGLFIPLYQKEALFIQLEGSMWHPSIAKVCVGRINAVTGDSLHENLNGHKQDYVLIPHQKWLDGINMGNGIVRQFVAMPLGQGYTIEEQITDEDTFGGFQLIFYPPKEGRFPERDPRIDSQIRIPEPTKISKPEEQIEDGETPSSQKPPLALVPEKPKSELQITKIDQLKPAATGALYSPDSPMLGSSAPQPNLTGVSKNALYSPAPQACPDMGIAAGGTIQQQIYSDIFGVSTWDSSCHRVISIRLVNSSTYKMITGFDPPPSPITPELYQKSGFPWFSYFDENLGSLKGSKILNKVQSIGEIEQRRGVVTPNTAPQPIKTMPPRIIRTPEVTELANELRVQANKYLESMNWKESLRSITVVLNIAKDITANDYVLRSNCNSQLGYFKEGFIDACLALEIDQDCVDALASRATCRLAIGDYVGAEEDADVLISNPTTERIGLAIHAELLLLHDRFQDAVYAALRAIKLYPNDKKLREILDKARVESVRHAKKNSS